MLIVVALLLLSIASCVHEREGTDQEKILVSIGDKTISVDEFKRRTEFTVRPIFPGQNPEALKNTCLNNLIIEKIFSLEAGHDSKLARNVSFQALLTGIKEQAMREQLYYRVAFDKADPDSNEIKKIYPLAGRTYEVEYLVLHRSQAIIISPDSLEALFDHLSRSTGGPFKQTVSYRDPEHPAIHAALFSKPLPLDTLIGPLQLEENSYMMMKVLNWKYVPAIGWEDSRTRWQQVAQKMKQNQADRLWRDFSKKTMQGKSINFDKATFSKVAALFFSIRPAAEEKGLSPFDRPFRQTEEQLHAVKAMADQESLLDAPFFKLDAQTWTVKDFRNELLSHPLVYRTQEITSENFQQQFTYAVADLIRDRFLAREAYRRSLDKDKKVLRAVAMWQDAYMALGFRNELMAKALASGKIDSTDNLQKQRYFNEAVQNLVKKYGDKISIDNQELDRITVTDVNMFVMQPQAPFPVVVPGFPQFTTNDSLQFLGP